MRKRRQPKIGPLEAAFVQKQVQQVYSPSDEYTFEEHVFMMKEKLVKIRSWLRRRVPRSELEDKEPKPGAGARYVEEYQSFLRTLDEGGELWYFLTPRHLWEGGDGYVVRRNKQIVGILFMTIR